MKILYFGIYEIGQRTLEKMLQIDGIEIVAVVTKYDTVFQTYSVSDFAKRNNLLCYTVRFFNRKSVFALFKKLEFDLIVVSGFHLKIPEEIIRLAKTTAINLHDSLLPKYKGPNASKWCIIKGENKTGVTVHHLTSKIDEGKIIAQREVQISPIDTAGTLFSRLASIGSDLLVEVISLIQKNKLTYFDVKDKTSSYYSYPTEDESRIKWDSFDADQIRCLVRGLNPRPGAFFYYNNNKYIVLEVQILTNNSRLKEGMVVSVTDGSLIVSTLTWDIEILVLRENIICDYSVEEFINENSLKTHDVLM